jgi:hypothetical protein
VTKGLAAQSTERISFSGQIVTWDQLPASVRRAARRPSPVVAEAVQRQAGEWTEGGRAVEGALGWRVHEDGVVVADVVRPVAPAMGGEWRPVGPWEDRGVRIWEASAPARHRRGVVDVAGELDAGGPSAAVVAAVDHRPAAEAWTYLPQTVRAAAERMVPEPVVWLGQIVQVRTADGFPTSQDVASLRMSDDRAVVLLARRTLLPIPGASREYHVAQMARVPWVVEQVSLDLGSPAAHRRLNPA